jgi:hypothetical protein
MRVGSERGLAVWPQLFQPYCYQPQLRGEAEGRGEGCWGCWECWEVVEPNDRLQPPPHEGRGGCCLPTPGLVETQVTGRLQGMVPLCLRRREAKSSQGLAVNFHKGYWQRNRHRVTKRYKYEMVCIKIICYTMVYFKTVCYKTVSYKTV